MNIDEKTIRKLIMQRDALAKGLGKLQDKLRHGILNGMLGERSHRRPDMDPKERCKCGHTRDEVRWSSGLCCVGCEPIGKCHVGLEEYDVFKAMSKASKLLALPNAEMPELSPEDFPKYEPEKYKYSVPPIGVARMIYRLVVGYWCFSDKDNKDMSLAWERAFNDSICILAGEDGPGLKKLLSIKTKEQAEEIIKNDQAVKDVKARFLDNYDPDDWDNFDNMSQEEQAKCLIIHFIVLRLEYQFAHSYPGGDMDVYNGVFESIIDLCLKMAGLYPSDRPNSYDFEDEDEYERKLLEYDVDHKAKIYEFMACPTLLVEAIDD